MTYGDKETDEDAIITEESEADGHQLPLGLSDSRNTRVRDLEEAGCFT